MANLQQKKGLVQNLVRDTRYRPPVKQTLLGQKPQLPTKPPTTGGASNIQQFIGMWVVGRRNEIPPAYLPLLQAMEAQKGSPLSSSDQIKIGLGTSGYGDLFKSYPNLKINQPFIDPSKITNNPQPTLPGDMTKIKQQPQPGSAIPGGWIQTPDGSWIGIDGNNGQTRPIGWNPNQPNVYPDLGRNRQQTQPIQPKPTIGIDPNRDTSRDNWPDLNKQPIKTLPPGFQPTPIPLVGEKNGVPYDYSQGGFPDGSRQPTQPDRGQFPKPLTPNPLQPVKRKIIKTAMTSGVSLPSGRSSGTGGFSSPIKLDPIGGLSPKSSTLYNNTI